MAAGVAAAGGGVGAVGSLLQGYGQSNALENSANIDDVNSREAFEAGQFDANALSLKADQRINTAEAAYGANGVTASSGSVLAVVAASKANAELDRLNILHGADIRAINAQNQASIDRAGARNAMTGAWLGAASSLLGAGGKIYNYGNGSGAKTGFDADPNPEAPGMSNAGEGAASGGF